MKNNINQTFTAYLEPSILSEFTTIIYYVRLTYLGLEATTYFNKYNIDNNIWRTEGKGHIAGS